MATGDWTVYIDTDPEGLATQLQTATVVVADSVQIKNKGGTWYAFVVEA